MTSFTPSLRSNQGLLHPEQFPIIQHLDDILPHISQNHGIRAFTNGPITVVRYLINDPSVFQTPWDLESRGLVFDTSTGLLLSRPFHKFFNHQGPDTAAMAVAAGPAILAQKHDGTMLGAFILNDVLHLHTKAGLTSHALTAKSRMPNHVAKLAHAAILKGYTPIFEWVGPDNRIVLPYAREDFILLALRRREDGIYDEALADALAQEHDVARPAILGRVETAEELMEWANRISKMEGSEGVVVVGPDGRRLKSKTQSYLSVHKAMTMLSAERHAFRAVVEEIDDDLIPLLSEEQAEFFAQYASQMRARILELGEEIDQVARGLRDQPRNEAARQIKETVAGDLQPLVFLALSGKSGAESLMKTLGRRTGSQSMVEAAREAYGLPHWSPPRGLFLKE